MSEAKKIPEKLARQFRTLTIVREQVEGDDPNRFSFALSSEEPAEQWFGAEVLKHDSKSIRQDRLKSGIPLLFNHDPNQHMGVVDNYDITGSKLRVQGKWSSSDFAQQKKRDYGDGILKDASVGYLIHKITREQDGEYPSSDDTLNVTDWEPLEASLVTIPADPTVGVGRSVGEQEIPVTVEVHRRNVSTTAAAAAIPVVIEVRTMAEPTVPDAGQIEIARRDRIMALGTDKDFSRHVTSAEIRAAFDSGQSAEAFSEALSRKIVAANDASTVGTAGSRVIADLGKDAKRYSVARAFRAAISSHKPGTFTTEDTQLEREVSVEIAKRAGLNTSNMVVPNAIVSRMPSNRAATTTTISATGAGYSAQSALLDTVTESDLIEMFRNRPRVLALGASRLGGLSGVVRLPRQDAAGSAQWLTETQTVAPSSVTTDFIALSPKRLSMQSIYTIELLAQSAVDVEAMLAKDRAKVLGLAVDLAAISGTGINGQPLGLLGASGLALVTPSGATLASTYKTLGYLDILNFETLIAEANADTSNMAWMFTPSVRAILKATPKFTNAIAQPIWDAQGKRDPDGIEDGPEGYRAAVTNQLPTNGGVGLNQHTAIFGDWSNILVADWGASELIVDPYTQAGSGAFVVTERSLMDVEFRHIQPFAACTTIAVQ